MFTAGLPVGRSAGRLVGWLVGRVGWLVGRVGWLGGWFGAFKSVVGCWRPTNYVGCKRCYPNVQVRFDVISPQSSKMN